jgi:hypothetical protein
MNNRQTAMISILLTLLSVTCISIQPSEKQISTSTLQITPSEAQLALETSTLNLPLVTNERANSVVNPLPNTFSNIHVFNDQLASSMSEAQFQFAATHYAGAQKMTRSDAEHLRQYNPSFVVLHYRLGLGLGYRSIQNDCDPTGDWLGIIEGNDWVREWPASVKESWFFHWPEDSSVLVLNCDWGWYLINLDDPDLRSYWSGEVLRQLQANSDDGLFADSFSVPNYLGGDRYAPALPDIDEAFESQWARRLENFIDFVQQGDLEPYYFFPNVGSWVTSRDTTDYSAVDGVMIEGFAEWGNAAYFDLSDWQLQMDRILGLVGQDRAILAQQYINADDTQERMFVLGSYLLIKGNHTYLNFDLGYDTEWFPEYDIPIGSPSEGIPEEINSLWNADWNIYTRTYNNGMVLVNSTATSQVISLDHTYYQAIPIGGGFVPEDGDISSWKMGYTPVTSLSLDRNQAAVLLNEEP